MAFLIGGANTLSTGDFVTNSLRLNDDDSPSLSFDLSSPNTDKFTISFWIKLTGARSYVASLGKRLTGEAGDDASINIDQGSTGRLGINAYDGVADATVAAYNSNTGDEGAMLRDTSAWYNLIYAFDTGQGTAGNRLKWYINGVLQSGYNTTTTPAEDADLFPSSGSMFRIGRALSTETRYADCYIAQYYYVDGQQYDHTYFGETNDNGVWVPVKNGTGAGGAITFGTNGFYLEFKETGTSANASGIGADTSGNDNHLTPANLAAIDITPDTPQNNFCTLNTLLRNATDTDQSYKEGNLIYTNETSNFRTVIGTMFAQNGKWYFEMEWTGGSQAFIGVVRDDDINNHENSYLGSSGWKTGGSIGYYSATGESNGQLYTGGGGYSTWNASWDVDDIVMCAMDLDNNKLYFGLNGTWQASGDPTSGATGTGSAYDLASGYHWGPAGTTQYHSSVGNGVISFNFGNPAFSISSGNADANGYGNFEFAPPSGYYALCTKNLAKYG
jgi:hypothetical protein